MAAWCRSGVSQGWRPYHPRTGNPNKTQAPKAESDWSSFLVKHGKACYVVNSFCQYSGQSHSCWYLFRILWVRKKQKDSAIDRKTRTIPNVTARSFCTWLLQLVVSFAFWNSSNPVQCSITMMIPIAFTLFGPRCLNHRELVCGKWWNTPSYGNSDEEWRSRGKSLLGFSQ